MSRPTAYPRTRARESGGERLRGAALRALAGLAARARSDRGDVPGWVMITLMTAGLVAAIWAIAGPALSGLFGSAIDSVSGN